MKLNIDAAFNIVTNVTGFSWCLRDAYGSFVLVHSTSYNQLLLVKEGKAVGLLLALA